jgi:accessory gene regulator B
MVETLAEHLAARIKKANPEQTASVAVMKFALIIVINAVIPIVAAIAFGALTGKWPETMLAIGYFAALRMISGGYHLEKPVPCMVVTFLIVAIPPHIPLSDEMAAWLTAISLVLVLWLAPANMKGYNTIPENYYPMLKILSALLVSGNFLLLSGTAAIVLTVQSITLLFRNKEVKTA